jgi:sterol desaturase/sphingolipid hydroxylase (fatty acid hydroxylase superfamily)
MDTPVHWPDHVGQFLLCWLCMYLFVVLILTGLDWCFARFAPANKIQKKRPYTTEQWKQEAALGVPTTFILTGILYYLAVFSKIKTLPFKLISCVQTVAFFIAWDLYLYGMHWSMHRWSWLYINVHKVHHQIKAPSCMTVISFHPVETFLFFLPLLAISLWPCNMETFVVLSVFVTGVSWLAHSGYSFKFYEQFHFIIDTTTIHDYHHEKTKSNFSIYLSIWDHLFGTYSMEHVAQTSNSHKNA